MHLFVCLEPSSRWLGDGQKNLHFVHSDQSYGGSKFNVLKNDAKVPYFGADLGVGPRVGPLHRQKRSKSQNLFSPQNRDFAGLMITQKNCNFGHSGQSYKPLKFRQKVPKCGGFCQVSTQWGFFLHLSLLVPARATRGREITCSNADKICYKKLLILNASTCYNVTLLRNDFSNRM